MRSFGAEWGWPLVLKTVRGGYDGRGVWVVADEAEAAAVVAGGADLLVEEHVKIDRELAVLVARRPGGEAVAWPVVETVQVDGICREVLAPVDRPEATALGLAVAEAIGVVGVLAVELFEAERRAARERAGHPPAQLRALDDRGGGHVAVREPPAGRARPAPRGDRRPGPGGGHGQRARRPPGHRSTVPAGRRSRGRTATSTSTCMARRPAQGASWGT